MHDDLQHERTRLANRLREQLRRYYPQFIEMVNDDVGAGWALAVWKIAPTPHEARKRRNAALQKTLKEYRIRRLDAKAVLAILRQPAMTVAEGTIEAATAHIELLAERLTVLNHQLKRCKKRIGALIDVVDATEDESGNDREQRDVEIALSLPGIGPIVLATLLAEASRALRERDYQALRTLSGIAPVTKRSGRKLTVSRRLACNPRLQNALYHWTRVAAQRDPLSKARYEALRSRGHSHGRALRTIGDRQLRVLCAMLRDGTLFRPAAELAA